MDEENTNQPQIYPKPELNSSPMPGSEKVIQPSEAIKQDFHAQKQPEVTVSPQTTNTPTPTNDYPQSGTGQTLTGISASQMDYNQPKSKLFDVSLKQLLAKGLVGLVVLGGIFTALVLTNVVALSEFKSTGYTNSQGVNFKLDFYTKHGAKQLQSGNAQLVSKVSKDGKFPLALSISTATGLSGYNRAKDCASFTKILDVQNNNLDQNISVCNFGKQGQLPANGVYIAGFVHDNKSYIITITQDYGSVDLTSQSGAQASLPRFGLEQYKADIERIVSSIKVE